MSFNHKLANCIIIGLGSVSSLAALILIIEFVGVEPDYQKVWEISSQVSASVTDSLTAFVISVMPNKAEVLYF